MKRSKEAWQSLFPSGWDNFIESILDAEKLGERVLLEPDKPIVISGMQASIDGMAAKEGLLDLYRFVEEFVDFLKIPEIKKIEEE